MLFPICVCLPAGGRGVCGYVCARASLLVAEGCVCVCVCVRAPPCWWQTCGCVYGCVAVCMPGTLDADQQ